MQTTPYLYLRGLQLEGRHPDDAGMWPVTLQRIEYGEGIPNPEGPLFHVPSDPDGPLPLPPEVPQKFRIWGPFYRRIRSLDEILTCLRTNVPSVGFAMEIFPSFVDEHGGRVPMPDSEEKPLPDPHFIVVREAWEKERLLVFPNTWGDRWGDQGWGYLPFEYFEKYAFECWRSEPDPAFRYRRTEWREPYLIERWTHDRGYLPRCYGFSIQDPKIKQQVAWSFAVERDGAIEVEELYVRPEFRGRGLGNLLADQLRGLIQARGGDVRLWVPFADCHSESEWTYEAMVSIVRRLGLVFQPCPVRWAAYLATNQRSGEWSERPIEPIWMPGRPQSSFKVAKAAALAVALVANPGEDRLVSEQAVPALEVSPEDLAKNKDFPVLDSPEWGAMNRRRAELIRKKVYQGIESLTPEERSELERLQAKSRKALAKAYPRPRGNRQLIDSLKARLAETSEPEEE